MARVVFSKLVLAGTICAFVAPAFAQAPIQLVPPGGGPPAAPSRPQQSAPNAPVPLPLPRPIEAAPSAPARPGGAAPATAARPAVTESGQLDQSQAATLSRITDAFNAIREMNGTFVQVDNNGARSIGRFFLTKPGRIRFQYDRPNPLDIVADGTDVVVRDRRLNTQDLYPLAQTPLRYLLNERIDLRRDAKVLAVFQDQGQISVTIEERGNFTEGQLTLFFDAANLQLTQWTITDARGQETAVSIRNVQTNQRNDPAVFRIDRLSNQQRTGN
jgi:outer membrane lipoprotein-sorting protein